MKKIALSLIEIFIFVLSLIFMIVSLSLCITLIVKAKGKKETTFAAITWILLSSFIWLAIVIIGISVFMTGSGLSTLAFVILQLFLFPFSTITWIYTFTEYKFKEKRKIFLIPIAIIIALFLLQLSIFLAVNPSMIVWRYGLFDISYRIVILPFLVVFLVFFLVTAILLFVHFNQSENQKIRTKGILLFVTFLSFTIGNFFYALVYLSSINLTIVFGFFITSAVTYFMSFSIPYENVTTAPRPAPHQMQLPPSPIRTTINRFCAKCGTPLKGTETFCTSCGSKI